MTNVNDATRRALARVPRMELADLPTPLERLEHTGDRLNLDLWVKRDDLTGTLYGGNKVRKLEYLFADAVATGHDEVWTVGAIGSHHVLATCIWAREVGLECGALHFPQPITDHVLDNLRALSTATPKLTLIGHKVGLPVQMFKVKLKEWLKTNPDVYYIPGGGSSPLGTLGYVNAAFELIDDFARLGEPLPEVIYVAAGTCGTLAGLTLGFKAAGVSIDVVGVRVVDKVVANPPLAAHLANRAASILDDYSAAPTPRLRHRDIHIEDGYLGDDYGVPTPEGLDAIRMVRELDGLKLEPTYTGKCFSALVDNAIGLSGRRVLYWHTLSGADLSDRVATADPERDLPPEYRDFFEDSP